MRKEVLQGQLSHYKEVLSKYFEAINSNKENFKGTITTSRYELTQDLIKLIKSSPIDLPKELAIFFKDIIGSGVWISYAYYRYIRSIYNADKVNNDFVNDPIHTKIIYSINNFLPINIEEVTIEDLFSSLFKEFSYYEKHKSFEKRIQKSDYTPYIVMVDGVFNELFRIQSFERGLQKLRNEGWIEYELAKTSGVKSSRHNSKQLNNQIKSIAEKVEKEKIWLFGFSKGGVDLLHFLKNNSDFANKKIEVLSLIACPILGSHHTNHLLLTLANKLTKIPYIEKIPLLEGIIKEDLKKSLSKNYQQTWFNRNHHILPKKVTYTAVALESNFKDSHFWMMMAKIIFQSKLENDGIVDIDSAQFPQYFNGLNYGVVKGHHLVGFRSSSFPQEAFLKAHVTLTNYLRETGLLKSTFKVQKN